MLVYFHEKLRSPDYTSVLVANGVLASQIRAGRRESPGKGNGAREYVPATCPGFNFKEEHRVSKLILGPREQG